MQVARNLKKPLRTLGPALIIMNHPTIWIWIVPGLVLFGEKLRLMVLRLMLQFIKRGSDDRDAELEESIEYWVDRCIQNLKWDTLKHLFDI